jgi:hypothetical protein
MEEYVYNKSIKNNKIYSDEIELLEKDLLADEEEFKNDEEVEQNLISKIEIQ